MKKVTMISIFTVFLLLLSACTAEKASELPVKKTSEPKGKAVLTIKDMAGREVAFAKRPERVVALTNSDMNIIYALGGKVVGRQTQDASGVYPEEAKKAAEVGNTHNLNLEKIAALSPSVVIASSEQNVKDVPALEGLGTKVVLTGANSISEIKQQTMILGKLLGKTDQAKALNNKVTIKEEEVSKKGQNKPVRSLLVLGAPGSNYAALPTSLSGDILTKAGGENVAKNFKGAQNFPQYAALNVEKIVVSNPQIIFLMIHGGDEKETEAAFQKEMKQNNAWKSVDAVKNNHIVVLPAALFGTNPGVRITEALDYMAKELHTVATQ
ncbi:ABC transporter substrate-binding protein [Listeria sp. PSOL-1]|uniref:ABC transporter substrate-binding protein n=1 Tax=Listeria sp. PSOL-1 TaxID=1844999 RepID=UPI0013CFF8DD|nr:ABC transporter substrate-binding protein [Listeria sp. PSOL-1]